MDLSDYELRSELNRKTFETLDWLIRAVTRGDLTREQFSTGIDTLFMAVNGLVDKEFVHILTEAAELAK